MPTVWAQGAAAATDAVSGVVSEAKSADAKALAYLEQFLREVRQGSAAFEQSVVATPTRGEAGGKAKQAKVSSGTLQFLRPQYLRMKYQRPYKQEIVADGSKLWFYDEDLEQITVRGQDATAQNTPLATLLAASRVEDLAKDFIVVYGSGDADVDGQSASASEEVQRVTLLPRREGGQIQRLELGLRKPNASQPPQLVELKSVDGFGQTSTLKLSYAAEVGASTKPLTASDFQFTPPKDVPVFAQ